MTSFSRAHEMDQGDGRERQAPVWDVLQTFVVEPKIGVDDRQFS
jgi:hypothetical protein